MPPRYCQNCSTEVPDNITDTCPKCGKPVEVPPDKTKSEFYAVILSLVIPGLGQAYCGALLKAIGFLLSFTFCLSLFAIFNIGIGIILFPIVWLIGIADAYLTAEGMNAGKVPWSESSLLIFGIFVVVVGIAFFLALMISAFLWIFR